MANFENVPVLLTGFEMEDSTMLWSVFISEVGQNIKVCSACMNCMAVCCCFGSKGFRQGMVLYLGSILKPFLCRDTCSSQAQLDYTRDQLACLFFRDLTAALHMQGQLVGVALSFLRNFGILSGASGVLGALSSGVASAALDDRFAVQRAQQKQVCPDIAWHCLKLLC